MLKRLKACEMGKAAIQMIRSNNVKNHKILNKARKHSGEDEKKELIAYEKYIRTKNCHMLMDRI